MHGVHFTVYLRFRHQYWMLRISSICVSQFSHNNWAKMAKNSVFWCFWPFLRESYVKPIVRRLMKLTALRIIIEISNILKNQLNRLCSSTWTQKTADFTKDAYVIPTKTFKPNARGEDIILGRWNFNTTVRYTTFVISTEAIFKKSWKTLHPIV